MRLQQTLGMITAIALFTAFTHPAIAATAVAVSDDDGFHVGVGNNFGTVVEARQEALQRCEFEGGNACVIALTCEQSGFGAFYVRHAGPGAPVLASGFVCGASSVDLARSEARRFCEYQLGLKLGVISGPAADWSFERIRRALAQAAGNGSNNSCGELLSWNDQA